MRNRLKLLAITGLYITTIAGCGKAETEDVKDIYVAEDEKQGNIISVGDNTASTNKKESKKESTEEENKTRAKHQ